MFITFVQRQPNVFDVGPTLYKCYKNVLCLLGVAPIKTMEMMEEIFVFAVGPIAKIHFYVMMSDL